MANQRKHPSDERKLSAAEQQLKAANQQLKASNQQLRASEQKIRKMEQNWRESFDSLEDVMILISRDFSVERINANGLKLIGKSEADVVGKRCYEVFHGLSAPYEGCPLKKSLSTGKVESIDRFEEDLGRYFSIKSSPVFDEEGKIVRFVDLMRDITKRKQAEEKLRAANQQLLSDEQQLRAANEQLRASEQQLRAANEQLRATEQQFKAANQQLLASEQQLKAANQQLHANEQQLRAANQQLRANEQQLKAANQQLQADVIERKRAEEQIKRDMKEKEVLIKEIHHRVKNNMQVISSILNLHSKHIEDEQALKIFRNGQSRIRSMALVHEKMYESEDLANIDFAEYIRSTTSYLFSLHRISEAIGWNIDIKDIFLDINTAIPCGLIINELVSNALKYAFPDGREGEIRIGLALDKDGKFTLTVEDNGIGFPKDTDFRKTKSLGMQLVIMLAEQIGGTIELERKEGTAFTIRFEKPQP
jgi:PAS domain S-box-containing protein